MWQRNRLYWYHTWYYRHNELITLCCTLCFIKLSHILASVLHGLLHTAGRVDGHDGPCQLRSQLHPLLLDVPPIQVVQLPFKQILGLIKWPTSTTRATGRKMFGLPTKPQNQPQTQQQIPRTHLLPGPTIPQTTSPAPHQPNQDQNNPKKQ